MNYFVTAIGTDSGKTLVSAILVKALQADYWKPVQCGLPRDTELVEYVVDNNHSVMHRETYFLNTPASPHTAAKIDEVEIKLDDFRLPDNDNHQLIIEGAGGVLVPLNTTDVVIDLATKFNCEIILVSNHYLGSINHTLLTAEELKRRNFKVKGIIFNQVENSHTSEADLIKIKSTEEIILSKTGYKCLLRIANEEHITQEVVMRYAMKLFEHWDE